MSTTYFGTHESIKLDSSYETFIARLEALTGLYDPSVESKIDQDPAWVESEITKMQGEQGLMIFEVHDHGLILKLFGIHKKAKQYTIGNPLIAASMNKLDLRSALYAPLRVLVYEGDGQTVYVEYDQPSTLFGQLGNAGVTDVRVSLDAKLKRLIDLADES